MNIQKFIVLWSIYSSTVYASTQVIPDQNNGNTIINIHVDGSSTSEQKQPITVQQQADHTSMQTTKVTTDATTIMQQKLYDFYQDQVKNAHKASINTLTWIQANKLKTISLTIFSAYAYLTYQIYRANTIINDPHSWSNWNSSHSLTDLFAISQARLESDILFEIQTRYVHPVNPTDFIYSIVQASNSLQEEIKVLSEQITRYRWISSCRCLELFFITSQDIEALQEKHRKLLFIKHIFACWCANYKIDKN